MGQARKDTLLGTLDLLVLRILSTGAAMHGYAIAERIQEISGDVLRVEEGSLYPALHRMEEAGWVKSAWRSSANNRRARYYRLTAAGRRRLLGVERHWTKHVDAVMRVLKLA
jgi:PadR family transcriptional regulator, regulatory protein PadR